MASISFPKFNDEAPSHQAALDLFKGRWASSLPPVDGVQLVAGEAPLFTGSPQVAQAAAAFGGGSGRLDGFRVLELGPLEGAHTYGLENVGADVLAVEGNAEAYLKCLIAKEILGLRSRFMLGDFVRFLEADDTAWDMILASGVLYHMVQPLQLIELICRRSPRCLLWTHYYDAAVCVGFESETKEHAGVSAPHYAKGYGDRSHGAFWGGLANHACMLEREDLLQAFRTFGHTKVEVIAETLEHAHGPYFTVVTSR